MINPTRAGKGILPNQIGKESSGAVKNNEAQSEASELDLLSVKPSNRNEPKSAEGKQTKELEVANRLSSQSRRDVREREDNFKKSLRTAISEKGSLNNKKSAPITPPDTDSKSVDLAEEMDYSRADVGAYVPQGSNATQAIEREDSHAAAGEVSAVIKFMKLMEEEFGISPQQLVAAMAAAQTVATQAGTQQQIPLMPTKEAFFQELGLEGPQIKRAEYLYQNMLKEMAQESMANYLRESNKELDIKVVDPSLMRKREINKSIDKMSQTFFLNDTRPAYGKVDPALLGQVPSNAANVSPNGELAQLQNIQNQAEAPQLSQQPSEKAQLSAAGGAMAIPAGFEATQKNDPRLMSMAQLAQSENQSQFQQVEATGEVSVAPASSALATALSIGAQTSYSESETSQGDNGAEFEGSKDSSIKISDVKTDASNEGGKVDAAAFSVSQNRATGASAATLGAASVDTKALDRPEDVMNVRNLIQNAQVLVRRGGGEMKVEMHPEGLGQVDLKVAVKEGKVDVQILAETSDTKRLLEKSIHELKASLAQQRLDVADVKVDVTKNMDRDMNDNSSDLNREQARQFLGQFRDERDQLRQGLFELPSMRQYKQSSSQKIQPPEPASQQPAAKNSKRLNVVV